MQGHTSVVARITTDLGEFILKKTNHLLYNEWIRREQSKLVQLANTALPIPRCIHYVEKGSECWLLMSYMDGIRLREYLANEHDKRKREKVIHSYGEVLKQIHNTPCPDSLKNQDTWLSIMLKEAENNLRYYEVDGTWELLEQLKANPPVDIENTLIHGDFTIDNAIVRDDRVVGVIDWGAAAYGDPRYDIALAIRPKPNAFENEIDKQLFFEAYGRMVISQEEFEYFENGLYDFF